MCKKTSNNCQYIPEIVDCENNEYTAKPDKCDYYLRVDRRQEVSVAKQYQGCDLGQTDKDIGFQQRIDQWQHDKNR